MLHLRQRVFSKRGASPYCPPDLPRRSMRRGRRRGYDRQQTTGAQFEISIDGTPRTYRDYKAMAIEAAEHLKRKHPHSAVTVENLQTGETTVVEHKPDLGPR
jgi:hypothetical protein